MLIQTYHILKGYSQSAFCFAEVLGAGVIEASVGFRILGRQVDRA